MIEHARAHAVDAFMSSLERQRGTKHHSSTLFRGIEAIQMRVYSLIMPLMVFSPFGVECFVPAAPLHLVDVAAPSNPQLSSSSWMLVHEQTVRKSLSSLENHSIQNSQSSSMLVMDKAIQRSFLLNQVDNDNDESAKSISTKVGEVLTFSYLGGSILAGAYGIYATAQRKKNGNDP